jgi:hypothetical protein
VKSPPFCDLGLEREFPALSITHYLFMFAGRVGRLIESLGFTACRNEGRHVRPDAAGGRKVDGVSVSPADANLGPR